MNDLTTDPARQSIGSRLLGLFGIDPRSLAACRVAIGSLLLVDLYVRTHDLAAVYGSDGLMPIRDVKKLYSTNLRWSLYWIDDSLSFHMAMFVVAACFAAALLVGYRTRLATIGSWIMLTSLHTRAPLINNGGDTFLLLLLFWSMFLPLGRVWSLDARRSSPTNRNQTFVSIGTVAILMQVCLVYWCTAMYKFDQNWNAGHGVQNALMWGGYNRPLGDWLLGYPDLMWVLSLGAVWLELIAPCLLFIPWRTAYFRMFTIMAFVGLHVGIELCMHLGLFSYVSIIAWMLFLPAMFWDASLWNPIRRWFGNGAEIEYHVPYDAYPPAAGRRSRATMVVNVFCAFCLIYVILHNVLGLVDRWRGPRALADRWKLPTYVVGAGHLLNLHQQWAMFARPMRFSVWYAARARLTDRSDVDLLRDGEPFSDVPPEHRAAVYPNHRLRKFCQSIADRDAWKPFRTAYTQYLYRRWNETHGQDKQIEHVRLICFHQVVAVGDAGEAYQMLIFESIVAPDANTDDALFEDKELWMGQTGTPKKTPGS